MSIRGLDAWLTRNPFDEEFPCDVCGHMADDCICPECPVCGTTGDPKCYEEHGLVRTPEQIAGRAALDKQMEEEAECDRRMVVEESMLDDAEEAMRKEQSDMEQS